MQAKITRDDIEVSPQFINRFADLCEIRKAKSNGKLVDRAFFKKGAVIDEPQCFRLVQMGIAIPADAECAKASGHDPSMTAELERRYVRQRDVPLDFWPLFDKEYITKVVYDEHDEPVFTPGPKWDEYQELLAKQAEQEEDDDE